MTRPLIWVCALAVSACAGGGKAPLEPDASEEDIDAALAPDARLFRDAALSPDATLKPDSSIAPDAAPKPDGSVAPDAAPKPDATPPDAAPSVTVMLSPQNLTVAHNNTVTMTVTLVDPAGAGGQAVTLSSDNPAVSVPTSVIVPSGETTATFLATGDQIASGVKIRATVGTGFSEATVRVAPAILGVDALFSSNVMLGDTATFTVYLEDTVTGAALEVALDTQYHSVATVPSTVLVPSGEDFVDFTVDTNDLGITEIEASIGNDVETTKVRVMGIFLSEILYDVTGSDDGQEWIELKNATPYDIDVDPDFFPLDVETSLAGSSWLTSLSIVGTIPSGGCVVVGGPSGDLNTGEAFDPNLGNGTGGDGIQLAYFGDVIDNVIYGEDNSDGIPDEDGIVPLFPDVSGAPTDQTLERYGPPDIDASWRIQATPSPGDCSALK